MDHCDECGFVYATLPASRIPDALRALAPRYRERLTEPVARLRAHTFPDVWSALEYACHVRDVLGVQRERLALALVQERPEFTPMGREKRVSELRYNEQDPRVVTEQVEAAAGALADAFAALDADGLERTAIYTWPAPAERTMAWVGRHTVHEGEHHLRDIDAALAATGS